MEIAHLKSLDVSASRRNRPDDHRLAEAHGAALQNRKSLSEQVMEDLGKSVVEHTKLQATARLASLDEFRLECFTHVGSEDWRAFITAAGE